jgi:IMP dehydrogenase
MKIVSTFPELTFNDVLLLPSFSDFKSDQDTTQTNIKAKLSKNITIDIPICSAPMPHLTEINMAITMGKLGGIGFLHCFQNFDSQLNQVLAIKKQNVKLAVSISDLSPKGLEHISHLLKLKTDLICIETAHAFNEFTLKFLKQIKTHFPQSQVCVALVVTKQATEALIKAGADSIRVGIGGGSHCTTRLVTGAGRPQLSALADCYSVARKYHIPIISDTGIQYPGDIAKAIAFGADTVMIGGLLTGTQECPGPIISQKGKLFKFSAGMCSPSATEHSPTHKAKYTLSQIKTILKKIILSSPGTFIPDYSKPFTYTHEGVSGLIPYKGSVAPIIGKLVGGLKRSLWYLGCHDLKQLRQNARIVTVTSNTQNDNVPRI